MSDKEPKNKDDLPELIKKLWLPIAGFLGAITLAYNFYQLWLGDQATVTYFLAGGGLLVLVIALAWIKFGKRQLTSSILLPGDKQVHQVYRFDFKYRQGASIALIGMFLIAATGIVSLLRHQQVQKQKLIIVIAAFEGPEDVYGLHNELIENLDKDFAGSESVEVIAVDAAVSPTQGSSFARKLGARYRADVVIWGWYRPTQNPNVTLHVENLSPLLVPVLNQSSTFQPIVILADLESFAFQQQLGSETTSLIHFLAGFIQYKDKHYDDALLMFNKSITTFENANTPVIDIQSFLYYYRGATLFSLDRAEKSLVDYTKAIELNSQFSEAYSARGFAYLVLNRYEQALADQATAIRLEPAKPETYSNRGITYNQLSQYDQAIVDYTKAIELDPQYSSAYNNRGLTYIRLKQYDLAIADFSRAIELNPEFAFAFNSRGLAYLTLEQYDLAIDDFLQAIKVDPDYEHAFNNLGNAYYQLKQYDEAIYNYSQAIQLDPQYSSPFYNRASVHEALKQLDLAIADYTQAIQLDSQDANAYYGRGNVYVQLKQYEQAIADYTDAIQRDPNYVNAYHNRGAIYAVLEKYEEAISDLTRVIELDPQNPSAYQNRSLAYARLGKLTEAMADHQKYEELSK